MLLTKKLTTFTEGINLNELVPYMMNHNLLTKAEAEQFYITTEPRAKQMLSLLSVLDSKGPLGYSLFAKCLQDEGSHVTHHQLYDLINETVDSSLIPDKPSMKRAYEESTDRECVTVLSKRFACRLSLHGVLKGRKYDQMIRAFKNCQYNGGWAEMEAEASKYLREGMSLVSYK